MLTRNTFISLLRGINVSGQKRVLMPELKSLYETLGFSQVTTYVQSGNVVFKSNLLDDTQIITSIEEGITGYFGFPVSVILRSTDDFGRILSSNPFLLRTGVDIERLYVTFLRQLPSNELLGYLKIPPGSEDEYQLVGKEIFLYCPGGLGRTKLSNNFFENKLKITATTRNWKTVHALYELAVAA